MNFIAATVESARDRRLRLPISPCGGEMCVTGGVNRRILFLEFGKIFCEFTVLDHHLCDFA
jgi:hypothetical protein